MKRGSNQRNPNPNARPGHRARRRAVPAARIVAAAPNCQGRVPAGRAPAAHHATRRRPRGGGRLRAPGVRAAVAGRTDPQPARRRHPRGGAARHPATSNWRSTTCTPRRKRWPSRSSRPAWRAMPLDLLGAGGSGGRRQRVHAQAAHLFGRAVLPSRDLRAGGGLRALPKDVARKRKLLAAVLDALGTRCKRVRQRMTVMPADYPVCDTAEDPVCLACREDVAASPRRKGKVLYAGVTWYRGDRLRLGDRFPRVRLEGRARHLGAGAGR